MKKVFISTGGFYKFKGTDVIKILTRAGIQDIELSGGKNLNKKEIERIIHLKQQYNLRMHNYFPPPKKKFIINLASSNKKILNKSISQIKKSIIGKLRNEINPD